MEETTDVIPDGHYWGQRYEGTKGILFELEGEAPVYFYWVDKTGNSHSDPLARESIGLWVMPIDYKESWKRFFVMKRPISAPLIFSGNTVKVYALPSHRITSRETFNKILHQASSTAWPDSPANGGKLSWSTWEEDIKAAFRTE